MGDLRVEDGKLTEEPEVFLASLGESLSEMEGVDKELVEILKAHLLKVSPASDAVTQANKAIQKLAGQRAHPPNPEESHGG
jgi:hypothetical protein